MNSKNAAIKILDLKLFSDSYEGLWGCKIDRPKVGAEIDTYSMEITGWVLSKNHPVEAVELISGGEVLRKVSLGKNTPDVAKVHPEVPGSKNCGFATAVGLVGLPLESEIIIEALLKNKSRLRIGQVQFRRLKTLSSDYQPKLQPLILTCLGRSGTTWLMRLLSEHPDIVVAGNYPYEILAAQYWAHFLKVTSEPANPLESTPKLHYFGKKMNWVGHHPFYDNVSGHGSFSWFGQNYTENLAAFCQKSIDDFYQQVAQENQKADEEERDSNQQKPIKYFAEKYHANFPQILQILSELYGDSREIFLVRDFRDAICSMLAFNTKRNRDGFGIKRFKKNEDFIKEFGENAVMPLLQRWQQKSNHAHLVRYEDLILSPVETMSAIIEHLGLDSSPTTVATIVEAASQDNRQLQRHKTSSSPQASIGRWREEMDPALQKVCNEVFAEAIEEFGYSENGSTQIFDLKLKQSSLENQQPIALPLEGQIEGQKKEKKEVLPTMGNLGKVAIENKTLSLNGWVASLKFGAADSFKVAIAGKEVDEFKQTLGIASPDIKKVHPKLKGAAKSRFNLTVPLKEKQLDVLQDSLIMLTPYFKGHEGGILLNVLNPSIKTPTKDFIKRFAGNIPGNFAHIAWKWLGHLISMVDIQPTDDVLDVGCGAGNMAYGLAYYLAPTASYEGLDIMENVTSWAREAIATVKPNFSFQQHDILHPIYNPTGTLSAVDFIFPYPEDSFDVASIINLFTHLRGEVVHHYLKETSRVLKSGGRCVCTCFLINEESKQLMARGLSSHNLVHEIKGGFTQDTKLPEKAVGFPEAAVEEWIEDSGLIVVDKYYGFWCGRNAIFGPDMLVIEKKNP